MRTPFTSAISLHKCCVSAPPHPRHDVFPELTCSLRHINFNHVRHRSLCSAQSILQETPSIGSTSSFESVKNHIRTSRTRRAPLLCISLLPTGGGILALEGDNDQLEKDLRRAANSTTLLPSRLLADRLTTLDESRQGLIAEDLNGWKLDLVRQGDAIVLQTCHTPEFADHQGTSLCYRPDSYQRFDASRSMASRFLADEQDLSSDRPLHTCWRIALR